MGQIVLYLEIFNFKTFRAEILQIFELLIWKIDDFINSFWLYLTFNLYAIFFFRQWWRFMQHLHGQSHWLCHFGMWTHVRLHQMCKIFERMPHLPKKSCQSSPYLYFLKGPKNIFNTVLLMQHELPNTGLSENLYIV